MNFNTALNQQYQDLVNEYQQQQTMLSSKDTSKYTAAQLEIKRKDLGDLLAKMQNFQTDGSADAAARRTRNCSRPSKESSWMRSRR